MSQALTEKKCIPCEGSESPLKGEALQHLLRLLDDEWKVIDEHQLEKTYEFENFRQALDFTNRAGAVAEEEGHHPKITLTWGRVDIEIFTHEIDGLSENDFILAAKVDRTY